MGRFIVSGGGGGGGTVTPPLSFGVGLTQTGLIVDLDPAREAPGEIGGFNEAPADGLLYARVNNAGVAEWSPVTPGGLPFMGANPPPPVPPATQIIAGTLWWRTTNGSLYVYFFDGLNYQWVTASPTGEVVGAPLIFPPAPVTGAVMTATNNVTYIFDGIAWTAEDIGGGPVHIGPLPPVLVAPATTYDPGTLWWRNDPDGVLFVWYDDGTSSQWVPATPASQSVTNPAGNDPSQIGIVWVPPRSATQGLELLDGYLTAPLATESMPGVINEPEVGDVEHVRVRDIATGLGKWVTATTGGGIGDVPVHPVQAWARANGRWVDVPVPDAGRGLTLTRTDENNYYSLDVATGIDLGGVFVPFNQGLELTPVGGLSLAPATPEIIGGLLDAPRDDTGLKAYARKWGQWVEAAFVDAPDDGKLYGRQYEGLGTPGDPFSMRWMEAIAPITVELLLNNKVSKSGDSMQGALFLPRSEIDPNDPGGPTLEYPNDNYHAVPKWYVDERAGGRVVTDPVAPANAVDGTLWWQSDTAGLYVFYDDGNSQQWVQVNGTRGFSDADVIHDAPVDDTLYGRLNQDWHQVNIPGDFKWAFQAADHDGWIKLDGRPLTNLTAKQSANASALGFATNIPDATGKVPMQNGLPLGDSSGTMSRTLSQANLPNISLTAGSTGAHTHTAASAGAHQHRSRGGIGGSGLQFEDMGGTGAWDNWGGYSNIGDTGTNYMTDQYLSETDGAHTHATDSQGAHSHTVPLGGTALPLDITPASLAVTAFIFLGR